MTRSLWQGKKERKEKVLLIAIKSKQIKTFSYQKKMFSLISGFLEQCFSKQEAQILILGMDKNANIPIILNLQEAMEFRSGIGAFAFSAIKAENPPKTRTFMEMYDTIKNTIEESINNSGNNELVGNPHLVGSEHLLSETP